MAGGSADLRQDAPATGAFGTRRAVEHRHPGIGRLEHMRSGLRVGRVVTGTMTTTLLLAYSGSHITMFMVFIAKGLAPANLLNAPFVAAEVLNILVGSFGEIPAAFGSILDGAFTGEGAAGGIIGALIVGFQRAAFSNEAGLGSASVAHSAVRTKEPATEGFVALLEPFIDTIVICTMTALTIIITKAYLDPAASELGGVALTSNAFASVLPWFPKVLAVAVVLFAFSTMISWSYYGMKATGYLFGDNPLAENVFKVIFLGFTVLGSVASLGSVIDFSDSMIFMMSIPNLIGLYLLRNVIRREFSHYRARLASGEIKEFADRH